MTGPIFTLGMLTFKKSPLEQVPILRQRAMLAESALHNIGLVLLEADNHDLREEKIQGHVWCGHRWTSQVTRIPDVVIIIGSERTSAQADAANWIRKNRVTLEDIGLSKGKASQRFADTELKKYLIPWESVPKEDTAAFFFRMLSKHPEGIVTKRTTANQGVGLLFTVQLRDGSYRVSNGTRSLEGSAEEVSTYLERSISGRLKYRDFITQKYVRSCTADGRSFDIRVHVQKRLDGQWAVTRDYVRLAACNSLLPNTSKGGYQGSLELLLKNRHNDHDGTIRAGILEAALEIARTQDSMGKKPLSELGIDLLLDDELRIWLIETNALPQSFHHEHLRAIYTLEYILYLYRTNHDEKSR